MSTISQWRLRAAFAARLSLQGWVTAEPLVHEDFLPRCAVGIFQSNLSGEGIRHDDRPGAGYDDAWLSGAIGLDVLDPYPLYEQQQTRSLSRVAGELDLPHPLG
ncbi:hypothetical protein [Streptomyces sp. NPDC007205]|uniref:2-oxoadipate dioxygenase/decarboxylase family protein n=1 Tax=Streptomyces sp. NPDC007205 TaxID=3154316 RepID=UPI0033D53F00